MNKIPTCRIIEHLYSCLIESDYYQALEMQGENNIERQAAHEAIRNLSTGLYKEIEPLLTAYSMPYEKHGFIVGFSYAIGLMQDSRALTLAMYNCEEENSI